MSEYRQVTLLATDDGAIVLESADDPEAWLVLRGAHIGDPEPGQSIVCMIIPAARAAEQEAELRKYKGAFLDAAAEIRGLRREVEQEGGDE